MPPLSLSLLLILVPCSTTLAQRTNFIDQDSKLIGLAEPEWFKENIPFLELPDSQIEAVYYYRWSSLKRHLRYTLPGAGYVVTEFVHKVGYSQKFDTINAAAGHHIDEAKWLRDTRYVKDYINTWAREGAGNQQYSEWIADAAYNAYLLNGDSAFIKSQQSGFVVNFYGWDHKWEPTLNLYFLSPHDDAMEHSASSEQTTDPYHGGLGYRPSFNSEMYANARAIVNIARLNGDTVTQMEFEQRAEAIRAAILNVLWDSDRKFFYHIFREDNPSLDLLDTREEIGFFPWRFGVPPKDDEEYEAAFESLWDPQRFKSAFGPTTCEQRSQWFDGNQTSQCCWWNGNSWPYSTGHTLRSLASQVKFYRPTFFANVDTFFSLLHQYAVTQYKGGVPYVAECHSALYDFWVCDGRNHSEHYAHSTYVDNVLSDLIGVEATDDNLFVVNPLVPFTWSYFAAENLLYHGHNVTVLYDRDGTKYGVGTGLRVYVNGDLRGFAANLTRLSVPIPSPIEEIFNPNQRMENYAANVNGFGYPKPSTSWNAPTDSTTWQAVDGRIFYDFIPSNRWSNWGSDAGLGGSDWFAVDFGPGKKKLVETIKLHVYSDFVTGEGTVDCPTSARVEYYDESLDAWLLAQSQVLTPRLCMPNTVWRIDFAPVQTQQIRVVFTNNVDNETFVGISELEIWGPFGSGNSYEAEDGYLGLDRIEEGVEGGITASETASGGSYVKVREDGKDFVEFTGVWADAKGQFDIDVYYSSSEEDIVVGVSINNIEESELLFPMTEGSDWGDFVRTRLTLERGNNVIIFKRNEGQGFVDLDKIQISFVL